MIEITPSILEAVFGVFASPDVKNKADALKKITELPIAVIGPRGWGDEKVVDVVEEGRVGTTLGPVAGAPEVVVDSDAVGQEAQGGSSSATTTTGGAEATTTGGEEGTDPGTPSPSDQQVQQADSISIPPSRPTPDDRRTPVVVDSDAAGLDDRTPGPDQQETLVRIDHITEKEADALFGGGFSAFENACSGGLLPPKLDVGGAPSGKILVESKKFPSILVFADKKQAVDSNSANSGFGSSAGSAVQDQYGTQSQKGPQHLSAGCQLLKRGMWEYLRRAYDKDGGGATGGASAFSDAAPSSVEPFLPDVSAATNVDATGETAAPAATLHGKKNGDLSRLYNPTNDDADEHYYRPLRIPRAFNDVCQRQAELLQKRCEMGYKKRALQFAAAKAKGREDHGDHGIKPESHNNGGTSTRKHERHLPPNATVEEWRKAHGIPEKSSVVIRCIPLDKWDPSKPQMIQTIAELPGKQFQVPDSSFREFLGR
ncbi:unnamed protein product [Amoebophrya sp. A25]|nr:unnamed protein product [Amoebophrya sp. A25]|eukprot:GSA25T00020932001.1